MIIILLVLSVILYKNNIEIRSTNNIQLDNIKIIESENTRLQEELLVANDNIEQYKNITNSFVGIDNQKGEYVYYPIDNLTCEQQEYIQNLCWSNNLSYEYILAILKTESNYQIDAVSYDGSSIGIMQIQKKYADSWADIIGLEEYDLFNFEDSIQLGIAVIVAYRTYWQEQGITDQDSLFIYITNSYNCGIEGFKSYIRKNGTINRSYSNIILNYKTQLETTNKLN